jgi:hypothetical protein
VVRIYHINGLKTSICFIKVSVIVNRKAYVKEIYITLRIKRCIEGFIDTQKGKPALNADYVGVYQFLLP